MNVKQYYHKLCDAAALRKLRFFSVSSKNQGPPNPAASSCNSAAPVSAPAPALIYLCFKCFVRQAVRFCAEDHSPTLIMLHIAGMRIGSGSCCKCGWCCGGTQKRRTKSFCE